MATSSIFTNVIINDSKMAERFVDALDSANRMRETTSPAPTKRSIMSKEELRELMAKRMQKK